MSRLSELLFGKEKTTEQDLQPQYSAEIQSYLDDLGNQSYMQGLLNQPKEKGLSLDQYKQGILQGLNYGVPEIAQAQEKLGINIPKTGEEISNAQLGQFNQYPMIKTGITNAPREGGLLNDLASGYRENYDNGFSFDNLAPNQNKGWATRIGEGLGTVGKFLDSPLGRGLITAGLVGATGGNGLQALSFGATAGVGRQNYQTQDKLFRQQLKNDYGYTDEDLNNIPGNLTKDMFNSLALSSYRTRSLRVRQDIANAKDLATKEKLIYQAHNNGQLSDEEAIIELNKIGKGVSELNKSNATRNADINKYLAPHRARAYDTGAIVGMGNLAVNQGKLGLQSEKFEQEKKQTESYNKDLAEYSQIIQGKDKGKKEYARQKFIERHGKDPNSLLEL